MDRTFFLLGSLGAGLAVALGAFGAHALQARLAPGLLAVYDTAVRYQTTHSLALLAVAWASTRWPGSARAFAASGWLFFAGIVLFSGSLYLLSLTGLRTWGAVTPLGGVAWLLGWACLAWGVWHAPSAGGRA
jgi:uncharacterized membrane protein YgdD (TMEM256/DUF423 family)